MGAQEWTFDISRDFYSVDLWLLGARSRTGDSLVVPGHVPK